ncbi:MAG TPA: bifunctional YncE family protein/alkaline phosphatase family protein, partial [Chloroflexota bacterium]|nr:bifunctional YncE family protein/alkaline phosphatase family protein [Chloroflexota bacterium]
MKRSLNVLCLTVALSLGVTGFALAAGVHGPFGRAVVGPGTGQKVLLAQNQWLNPTGTRALVDKDGRIVSSTVSPDGKYMAALSWQEFTGFLTIINLQTNKIVQEVGGYPNPAMGDGSVGADGPYYSPDGKSLWVGQTYDLLRFPVNSDGTVDTKNMVTIHLPTTGTGGAALPSGMAFSSDGSIAYVALNGYNTLGVIDTKTNTLTNQIAVGVAPRQVVISGNNAYVSSEGGYQIGPPNYNYTTINLTDATPVYSDPITGAAVTGTVSVVDLTKQAQSQQIQVGLGPSAELLNGTTLLVANSNSDSISVIDTSTNQVVNTVSTDPFKGTTNGSDPNALLMPDSSHLVVSVGRNNALAVYSYASPTKITFMGLIATDEYPVNASKDATAGQIVVTNDKGIGSFGYQSTISKGPGTNKATGWNTYDDTASLTEFSWSSALANLAASTKQVWTNNGWHSLGATTPITYCRCKAVPLPTVLGAPSTIKHIFLIVRENRTYDQLFGDMKTGNGDAADVQFGANVTPNAHALATRFGLFDNFYDPATLSADGHNWIMQANSNDYIEKEFGAFYRSYPSVGADALAYQPSGFLWTDAQSVGKRAEDFGEYEGYQNLPVSGAPTWSQWYKDSLILQGKASGALPVPENKYLSNGDVPSINAIEDPLYPVFNLNIPDQYRVDVWLQRFRHEEKVHQLPNLVMMTLPDDHTGGAGNPYPVAQVADNDLATARVVQAISRSRWWKSSLIIVEEDDSQNGVDHVDGHRAPLLMISPWVKQSGVVNNTYYTQLNVDKTIERILGMPPLNQMDRAAQPMYNVFTDHPNKAAFNALPENIPLNQGVTAAPAIPASEHGTYKSWLTWERQQPFNGFHAAADMSDPRLLNRLDWYMAYNWTKPYP